VLCDADLRQPLIFLRKIPEGYPGTLRTVEHIKQLMRQGAKDFHVRQTAIDVLFQRRVKAKDYVGEIKALFEWVQQNIRYTKDTFRLEVLHSARRMLELRAGDCDDFSILLGAMLEAIGHPVRLVLTGPNPQRQDLFSHIYLEVYCKGRWLALDATMPHPMGWAPRTSVRKVVAIDRRPTMMADDMELRGIGADTMVPDWLRGLIRAVRREAILPKDARVKSLWDLLRQRQVLSSSPWVKGLLLRCWQGLPARERPRATRRLVAQLRALGILPPRAPGAVTQGPVLAPIHIHNVRPGWPIRLRPVAAMRPTSLRPVRAVSPMRPVRFVPTMRPVRAVAASRGVRR
jgi:Transglutaminase-like superfamily